jgi:hypothetical protein
MSNITSIENARTFKRAGLPLNTTVEHKTLPLITEADYRLIRGRLLKRYSLTRSSEAVTTNVCNPDNEKENGFDDNPSPNLMPPHSKICQRGCLSYCPTPNGGRADIPHTMRLIHRGRLLRGGHTNSATAILALSAPGSRISAPAKAIARLIW